MLELDPESMNPDPKHLSYSPATEFSSLKSASLSYFTSVQTSVSGVNTTVKDMKEVIGTLEEKLELLSATTNNIDSKLQVSQC
jgi:hypothetical protein